jgi:hypothetical protein
MLDMIQRSLTTMKVLYVYVTDRDDYNPIASNFADLINIIRGED